jgi:hypothetical protein
VNIKLYKFATKTNYMFWNKKDDKKGLPDLPPSKMPVNADLLRDLQKANEPLSLKELPTFPEAPSERVPSETAIKEVIEEPPAETAPAEKLSLPKIIEQPEDLEEAIGQKQTIKTIEMDEWTPESDAPLGEPPAEKPKVKEQAYKPEKKGGDVFVKIDRFNTARRSLNSIKQKIEEMDVLLKKIRDVKLREEQEIASWEKDVATLKSRLQDINDNVFS